MFGEKAKPYQDQDYKKLKDQCVANGELFTDPTFPPNNTSLSFSGSVKRNYEWKRPGEIISNPKLFVDGASSDDFSQGSLGNCWFIAACAGIANEPKLWKKIVPDWEKQEWKDGNKYAGIFHFRFFRLGEWYDVVIDDLLPSENGKLVYCSSQSGNEFWSALLEKAYAKLFGDYESLKAGHAKEALVDMTGGVGESVTLADYKDEAKKAELFEQMEEAYENRSLMSASISGGSVSTEEKLASGLIATHAYTITCVKEMKLGTGMQATFKREKIKMVRCRNPWGGSEWTGAWSDGSAEWQKVSDKEKKEIGLEFENDGEFWMSFEDFLKEFTSMDICHLINKSIFSLRKTWKENIGYGEWKAPDRAGGCFNHDSKLDNPQYMFDIEEDKSDVMFSLEQEDARIWREHGKKNATIGFTICKADLNREYRMHDVYEQVVTSTFINTRGMFHRMKLTRGRYLIIPATFDPGHEGRFMLRVYCGKNPQLTELTLDQPKLGGCCGPKNRGATSVLMVKAVALEKQDFRGGADPYCVIKMDGQKLETPHIEDSLNPEWNWRATFYKKKRASDIVVEVWNRNIGRDEIMGQFTVMAASTKYRNESVQEFNMLGVGKESSSYRPGRIYIQVKHYDELSLA